MKLVKYSEFSIDNNYYEKDDDTNEGLKDFWQDIKYGLSKLGRYKAGGKIFGKKKTDDEAREKIKKIMAKESNKLLKQVHGEVLIQAPEFPNDRRKITFLRGVIMYGQLYDSLVAAAKKKPDEEGYLAPEVVNEIILDLREVIKKYLDVDLKAVYTTFESKDDITDYEMMRLNEDFKSFDEYESINEEEIIGRIADWMFGKKMGKDKPQKMTKTQSAKYQATSGEQDIESERMKTLASNRLPLILAGIGGALGALSWIAQTDWFKDLVTETIYHPAKYGEKTFTTIIEKNLKVDPNGWSYTIQNNGFLQSTGKSLNWNQPVGNLEQAFKYYGGGDVKKGIESMSSFLGPQYRADSVNNIVQQLADPSNKTVGDIFNHLEGTWGDKALMNQFGGAKTAIAKQVFKETKRVLIKAGFTTTTTSVIGGKLISLAPILGYIGIALVGAGAIVKMLRLKGQRQSRAKTLNDLLQSLQLVKVGGETPVIDEEQGDDKKDKKTQDQKEKEQENKIQVQKEKMSRGKLYALMIKNLKALQSSINTIKFINIGGASTEGTKKDSKSESSQLVVGKEYLFTNKKGIQNVVKLLSLTNKMKIGDDKKWMTKDDSEVDELKKGAVFVIFQDKKGGYSSASPQMAVSASQLSELGSDSFKENYYLDGIYSPIMENGYKSRIVSFEIFEKRIGELTSPSSGVNSRRRINIDPTENHAVQAFKNMEKTIKTLTDEKGVAITIDFIQMILDSVPAIEKESSDAKEYIFLLYEDIYEYLYGKYSNTLSDLGPLYKESLNEISTKGRRQRVAEKIARFAKRSLLFEGENLYGPLGEFGSDLKDFNESLKPIMEYFK